MAERGLSVDHSTVHRWVVHFSPKTGSRVRRKRRLPRNAAWHGVSRINFDLIFGLPHQSVQSCVQTARAAVAMRPNRLAVFGYPQSG